MTKNKPITELEPTGDIVIPVSQHIGSPATPIVEKGDSVLVGQKIAEVSGFISANVHSSVSGIVKKIEKRLLSNGSQTECIIIENDNNYEKVPEKSLLPFEQLSKEEIREYVKEAGIVGLGGAGFPANVKLTPKNEDNIEYILINGAECEPYLTTDYRMMIEQPEKLIEGLKIILSLFDRAKCIIGIEENKMDAIVKLSKLTKKEQRINVKGLYTKYPQGGERMLIHALTKRHVNAKMLPADVGCIVHNVSTVLAIRDAVIEGTPLIRTVVTVTGDAIKKPQNFLVRIGTNTRELIDAAGGFIGNPEKIISGGPMMGKGMYDIDVPITKTSSGILCFSKDEVSAWESTQCIRCGRCVKICPARLVPTKLADYSKKGNKEAFHKAYGMECCECGCCSYGCPAKINLTQSIITMKRSAGKNV